jgi:hypothetical protein
MRPARWLRGRDISARHPYTIQAELAEADAGSCASFIEFVRDVRISQEH